MSSRPQKASLDAAQLWTALWALMMTVALWARPPLPVDETRYLSVAWEMWMRGSQLVPFLNGEPYSHKPPLLFWLMQMGWTIFGVNDWWPRLVAPLFGLASLFLTRRLARELWPDAEEVSVTAPLLLMACTFWSVFTTVTMFDMMFAGFTLVGMIGLIRAWREGGWQGWAIFAAAIGFGVLAKGPAILIHLLPVALAAPFWAKGTWTGRRATSSGWGRWYRNLGLSFLGGAAIALLWAAPAAILGGPVYRNAIFWGQSAGRIVESFAHRRPPWFYLELLPVFMLPLSLWPGLWKALRPWRVLWADGAIRFCVIWFGTAFVLFSLISGKQPQYLLPEFPAIALLAARAVAALPADPGPRSHLLPAVIIGIVGLTVTLVALGVVGHLPPEYSGHPDPMWGAVLAGLGLGAAMVPLRGAVPRAALLAVLASATVLTADLTARPLLREAFTLEPLAQRLHGWQEGGLRLANYGAYHGEYGFLGRLTEPVDIVGDGQIHTWIAAHPDGKIITYQEEVPPEGIQPDATQPFRSHLITVWDAAKVKDDVTLVRRPQR